MSRLFEWRRLFEWADRFGRWALILAYITAVALTALIVASVRVPPAPAGRPVASTASTLVGTALLAAAATGTIAAAVVEVLKRLTGVRGEFHLHEFQRYLAEQPGRADPSSPAEISAVWLQLQRVLGDLWSTSPTLTEARAGRAHPRRDARYFFSLPLEQLTGQIAAGLELALSEPSEYPELLAAFGGGPVDPELLNPATAPDDTRRVALLALLNERIQRRLDSMLVIIGHRWRWFVRGLAALVCAVLGVLAVESAGVTGSARVVIWLACAVPGAFFAWLARDVSAVIERARR